MTVVTKCPFLGRVLNADEASFVQKEQLCDIYLNVVLLKIYFPSAQFIFSTKCHHILLWLSLQVHSSTSFRLNTQHFCR